MRKIIFAALAAAMMLPAAADARDHGRRGWEGHDRGNHYGWDRHDRVVVVEQRPYQPFYYDCGGYYARSCVRPYYAPSRVRYYEPAPSLSLGINVR